MPIVVRAMPDRVVLRFPEAVTDIRGIQVPNAWALRREVGELVAIGDTTNEQSARAKREILRLTGNTPWLQFRARYLGWLNRLTGWTKPEAKFLVSMSIGTYYWRKELASFAGEFDFLRDLRVYNITELATAISGAHADEFSAPLVAEPEPESKIEIPAKVLMVPR